MASLSSIVIDRILDLFALLGLFLVILILHYSKLSMIIPSPIYSFGLLIGITSLLLGVTYYIYRDPSRISKFANKLGTKFFPKRELTLAKTSRNFIEGLTARSSNGRIIFPVLKAFGEDGFVFYTNSNSKKGKQLSKTPYASLCFYWKSLLRQVRVEGIISKVNDSDADIYFASRSRDSQVGAWASKQSSKLSEQSDLDKRILKFTQKYEGGEVPRPDFWEGYSVLPEKIEFWLQQDSRLHERIEYTKIKKGWAHQRLYP